MTNTIRTKKEAVRFLDENYPNITDKSLADRIRYTANSMRKDIKSVSFADLKELCAETEKHLAEVTSNEVPAPAEPEKVAPAASLKKTSEKAEKAKAVSKAVEKAIEKVDEQPKEEKPAGKKTSLKKKPAEKKAPAKKSAVADSETGHSVDIAMSFKDTFDTEIGSMHKASDLKTFDDLREAIEAGEEIYFAFYWTARLLRQYPYCNIKTIANPKKFDNNVDLVSLIFIDDDDKLAVGISSITSAPYFLIPDDLKPLEDGIRYSSGMEFEVYRLEPGEEDVAEEE